MHEMKDTARALVRIGYDGRVHKTFRGHLAKQRFDHEVRVLRHLEGAAAPSVPPVARGRSANLKIVDDQLRPARRSGQRRAQRELWAELENVRRAPRRPGRPHINYRTTDGRFCIIDLNSRRSSTAARQTRLANPPSPNEHCEEKILRRRPPRVRWSGMTHIGRVRPNNEDVFSRALSSTTARCATSAKTGEASLADADFISP